MRQSIVAFMLLGTLVVGGFCVSAGAQAKPISAADWGANNTAQEPQASEPPSPGEAAPATAPEQESPAATAAPEPAAATPEEAPAPAPEPAPAEAAPNAEPEQPASDPRTPGTRRPSRRACASTP